MTPRLKRCAEASDRASAANGPESDASRGESLPLPAKKRRWNFTPPPARRLPQRPPSVSRLVIATASPKKPSDEVRAKIGGWKMLAGIDVETHGWERVESIGGLGQYGFYCICPPAKLQARIVQLGWVVGEINGNPVRKERIVKPIDFQIEDKAARFHGISHEHAMADGLPLPQVLEEFLDDMLAASLGGGRMICHHLEFDAGIIANEIDRAGLGSRKHEWETFACQGFCTMDACIGKWLRECAGWETRAEPHLNIMKLPAMVEALRPYRSSWPPWVQHTAGDDAQTHFAIYEALVELLRRADEI